MENEIITTTEKIFEDIKHIDERGNEYWYARELMVALGYKSWDWFKNNVIEKAKTSCKTANTIENEHFSQLGKVLNLSNEAINYIENYDFKLTRYACYLIAQNGSPTKKQIALAQTYFAVRTRQQELTEQQYMQLSEDEKIATYTHYNVGKVIRETIKQLGGTMPEDLPTPEKVLKN